MSTEGETYTDLGDTLPDVVWRGYRSGGMTDEQTAQVMALVRDHILGPPSAGKSPGCDCGADWQCKYIEQAIKRLVEDGDRLRAELLGEPCWAVAWGPSGDGPDRYSTIGGQGPECGKCPSCLRRARAALAAHTEPASKEGAATAHQEVTG